MRRRVKLLHGALAFVFLTIVGWGIVRRVPLVNTQRAVAFAAGALLQCPESKARGTMRLVTVATASDCATCRDHLAGWDHRPSAADSLDHVVLVFAPAGQRVEAEGALRLQTRRPVCVDTVGNWLQAMSDKRTPRTYLLRENVELVSWIGPLDQPAAAERAWHTVDSAMFASGITEMR